MSSAPTSLWLTKVRVNVGVRVRVNVRFGVKVMSGMR